MAYFFDELSSKFYSSTDRTLYLQPVTLTMQPPVIDISNRSLVYMGTKVNTSSGGGAPQGYALMRDQSDPTQTSLHQVNPQGATGLRLTSVAVTGDKKLQQGENHTLLIGDQNLMLFSVGSQVWSYNLTSNQETLQFTVPAGERITFIRHRKLSGTGAEAAFNYNYVMIGTEASGKYKIRMFNKDALGNLLPNPEFVLEGNGRAVDALFVGPAVSTNMVYSYSY